MQSIREWYGRRILGNLPLILEHFDEALGIFRCEKGKDSVYRHCLRPLAFFYRHPAEGNPFHGDRAVLDKIIRAGDYIIGPNGRDEDGDLGTEWIPYNLMECVQWLADDLGPQRAGRWKAAVATHLDTLKRASNYVCTAPNHHMWQAALLYRAGQVFDHEGWRRSGQFLARQICGMQTADGYWDESRRGQGPSPNYHRTHLQGLDLYYRFSDDEQVRGALDRAIDFAIRSAYPDGTPIDVFDSRQPYLAAFAVAMAANAICRVPAGRRLVRSQMARLDALGVTDARSPVGFALNWYLFATTDFMLDCYRFADEGDETPLPVERDGHRDTFTFHGQQGFGGGVILRRGDWTVAVSACQTDLPRATNHIYNTERQSGFSLFHQRAGLIVGGGNRMRNHIPLANAQVLTGWMGVDCVGGRFPDALVTNHGLPIQPDGTSTEASDPVKACYYPLRRRAELTDSGARLSLDFMHARIRFDLEVRDGRRLAVRYAFAGVDTKKILLQVPIPLFHPGRFQIDGRPFQVDDLEKIQTVPVAKAVELVARAQAVRYAPAGPEPAVFTFPMEPIKNWQFVGFNYIPDVRYRPLYTVGLLSVEFRAAEGEGTLVDIEVG